jgi:hypothetical protein
VENTPRETKTKKYLRAVLKRTMTMKLKMQANQLNSSVGETETDMGEGPGPRALQQLRISSGKHNLVDSVSANLSSWGWPTFYQLSHIKARCAATNEVDNPSVVPRFLKKIESLSLRYPYTPSWGFANPRVNRETHESRVKLAVENMVVWTKRVALKSSRCAQSREVQDMTLRTSSLSFARLPP